MAVVFVAACDSGNDNTSPLNTPVTVQAQSPATDNPVAGIAADTGGDSGADESEPVETDTAESTPVNSVTVEPEITDTDATVTQDANHQSGDDTIETDTANQQNAGAQTNTDSPQAPTITEQRRVNFGAAELLVDLIPNGDSYPAKFHSAGGKLYFWTVDTDPRFASCSWHWGNLNDDDKDIAFNLVAIHPETGAVAMNKQMMTLGDFADDPNSACAGYNGSVMQVYEQWWITPESSAREQQFILHFDSLPLGPDRVWQTDGSEDNTSLLAIGKTEEIVFFEGDKVFFAGPDGLWVSDTLSGDRRKLYESTNQWFYGSIKRIVRSPARQATFEIRVGENRFQIWTYDLDTNAWEKKFSIKPDDNTYFHYETLLVDGQTLLSHGQNAIEGRSALGYSGNYGEVTSFEIVSESSPSFSIIDSPTNGYSSNGNNNERLLYHTTDFSVKPPVTSVWSYREEQIEKLFSIPESDLQEKKIITGQDGHIYVIGTKQVRNWSNFSTSLELWSYHPQTEALTKLSSDDWYSVLFDYPTPDEGYVFRYLNTPDGLIFVNLKEDSGRELWFTDGTREGTRQLTDINPGTGNSDPQNFYHSGDAIYFSANDGTSGHEPWMIRITR